MVSVRLTKGNLAAVYYQSGDVSNSLKEFERATELAPNGFFRELWFYSQYRATIYRDLGQADKALAVCDETLRHLPKTGACKPSLLFLSRYAV